MQPSPEIALLREYAENGSERAFAELVTNHAGLVYSTALRQVGNPTQAEEVTQAVFVILARKAKTINERTILTGWLYHTTRLTAKNLVRQEIRRALREEQACLQTQSQGQVSDLWSQLAPVLDIAIGRLNPKDRDAILLRFFQGKTMQEIGTAFGTSENAAKKRVGRALRKLRNFFSKSHITIKDLAFEEMVASHCVQEPTERVVSAVIAAGLSGAYLTDTAFSLTQATLKTIAWRKLTMAASIGVIAIAACLIFLTPAFLSLHRRTQTKDFEVDGIVVASLTNSSGRILSYRKDAFSMFVKEDGRWTIRAKPMQSIFMDRERRDLEDLFVASTDLTNVYYRVNFPTNSSHLPKASNDSMEIIGRGVVPFGFPGTTFYVLWYGFASGSYLQRVVDGYVQPVGIPAELAESRKDFYVNAEWKFAPTLPLLPVFVKFGNKFVDVGQSPQPSETFGITNCLLTGMSFHRVGQLALPTEIRANFFVVESNGMTTKPHLQVSVTVTNAHNDPVHGVFTLSPGDKTLVIDLRRKTRRGSGVVVQNPANQLEVPQASVDSH